MRRRYNQSLRGGGKNFKKIVTEAYKAANNPHFVDGDVFPRLSLNADLTGFRSAFRNTIFNLTGLSPYFQKFATHLSKYVHNPVYATLWIHYGKGKNLEPLRHWEKKDATETSVGTFTPINNIEKLKKAVTNTLALLTPTTQNGIERSEIDARKIFQKGFFMRAGRPVAAVVGALATAALLKTANTYMGENKVQDDTVVGNWETNSTIANIPPNVLNTTAEAEMEALDTTTKQCDKNEHAERDAAIVKDAEQDVQTARENVNTLTDRPSVQGYDQYRRMELREAIKHQQDAEKNHADLQKKYIENHGFLKYAEHKIDTTYKSTDTGSGGCLIS